jgi:hypothetical protein
VTARTIGGETFKEVWRVEVGDAREVRE